MEKLLLSPFIQHLKTEISDDVFKKLAPLFQTAQQPQKEPTDYLTRKEAAQLLSISLPTLHEWTKTGLVQGYRIASRVRYKRAELETSLTQIKTRRAA